MCVCVCVVISVFSSLPKHESFLLTFPPSCPAPLEGSLAVNRTSEYSLRLLYSSYTQSPSMGLTLSFSLGFYLFFSTLIYFSTSTKYFFLLLKFRFFFFNIYFFSFHFLGISGSNLSGIIVFFFPELLLFYHIL